MIKGVVLLLLSLILLACSETKTIKPITIKDSIQAHKQSQDFHSWIDSQYHPDQLIMSKNINCSELSALSDEELAIFYQSLALKEAEELLTTSCTSQLIQRIESYYQGFQTAQSLAGLRVDKLHLKPTRRVPVRTVGGPVYWYGERGGLNKKELSLTFDDGPHPRLTPQLLDILDEMQVKATFFVLGKNAKAYPDIIKDIEARGHILANHSHSHHNLPKYSTQHGIEEIEKGFGSVQNITSGINSFFRFPYGAKTTALQQYLKQTNVATFFWDIDTLDWKKTNPQKLHQYAIEQVYKYNNGIVLFHDVQPQTIAVMRGFLLELISDGYQFAQHVQD